MSSISHFLMWFCNWVDYSFFGAGVRNSAWLFPCIEIFHLLALGILGGTVLLMNARLLGLRFADEPVSELANDIQPWMYISLGVVLVSGFFLFSSESMKMYDNPAFRIKMVALVLAILFSFALHGKVKRWDESHLAAAWPKWAAIVSLALWTSVGLAGRAIGYVPQLH
ncbi:MAG: DUF6644 family protein [Candidatus Acidiferrales bacterium]